MAIVTRPTTPLPNPGDEIEAEQVRDWINNIISFLEESTIDENNVSLTATNGIVGKSTNQVITGTKSLTSTATGSGANTAAIISLNPTDSTVSNNDGPRLAFQTLNNASALHDYGYLDVIATDTTATSEDGKFVFYVYKDGSAVEAFSIVSTGPVFTGNITSYEDANNADVTISIGTSATESFNIVAENGGSNKTLEQVTFESKTASGTADHGKMVFKVDEVEIASIEDDGIHATIGGVKIADDKTLTFGSDGNYTVEYDEDGTDKLIVSSAVDGAALSIILQADRGDDAGDEWLLNIADGGVLTLANDKASAGTFANGKLTLTASATASVLDFGGNATLYNDLNNADVSFAMGTSATESFNVITTNGSSDKSLYDVQFTTKTASTTADRGKFVFNVDETEIATIDDGGIELAAGKTISGLLSGTNLGMVYNNSNDLATASGITTDGTTLRVGASGGSAGQQLQVYGDTDGSHVKFTDSSDTAIFTAYDITATSGTVNKPAVTITNTHADATAGKLIFTKDPATGQGADNDVMGTIEFFGTDASNNAVEKLAYIDSYVVEADHGSEAAGLRFYVAENDATITTLGLSIVGHATTDGRIDVTLGAGTASVVTIPGSIDLEGDVDVNGTLEADAITLGGTALGSLYQSLDADLTAIAGLSNSDGNFIVGSASGWVAESGATARTSLGLGTMAVAATGDYSVVAGSSSIVTVGTISTGTWQGTAIASAYLDADTAHLSGSTFTGAVTVGANTDGHDVKFFGNSSGSFALFDESEDDLVLTNYGISVGSDATGDIYYRDANGYLARLAKGTNGHYLKQGASIPGWAAVSTPASGYTDFALKDTNYTASDKDQLICKHASTAFTITLPSSPTAMDTVIIKNVGAATVTVGRNSSNIDSAAADGTLLEGGAVQLVYVDSTIGWASL
jgi:hypothetical protein